MSDLYWLTDDQLERMRPFFPLSHGKPRVDDRRVLSGIIFINRNGLRWRNAPSAYGPPKTLYNRWVRWSRMGVFARILMALADEGQDTEILMIDATHLKAHRTASSLRGSSTVKKTVRGTVFQPNGGQTVYRANQGRAEFQVAPRDRRMRSPDPDVSERRADQRLHRCGGPCEFAAKGRGPAGGSRLMRHVRHWFERNGACQLVP